MHASRSHAFPPLSAARAGLALGLLLGLACPARAVGTWTPVAAQAPDAIGTTFLLTDGTVMAQGSAGVGGDNGNGSSAHWYRLTPDAYGSYANGAWTQLADMHHQRLYYASAVLRNGKVFIAGGEYTEAGYVDANTAEIYDPAAGAWTEIAGPPGWANIGDAPVKTLFDGTLLLGSINSDQTGLYDYTTNTWAAGGTTSSGSSEASWALLPDQSVLTCDPGTGLGAEKYLPSSKTWVRAGQTPVAVVQAGSNEIGPAVLLPDGRCLYVGATGHTALYTMPSSPALSGSWIAGPDFPADAGGNQLEAKDAPGCLMVNGKVLCVVAPHGDSNGGYPVGQRFFEYTPDPSGLSGGALAAAPDSGLDSANSPAYAGRMLALPNGQVLLSNFNSRLALYTPDGGPDPAWKPAVSGITAQADGSYRVSGTQFNGLSEGASYGDDASQSTNYPLVRLTAGSGVVTYARTFGHSTMGLATGGLPVATSFTTPAGLAPGAYRLQVVANGIASDPMGFTLQATTSAAFVGSDAATQGNWKGLYGADGYSLSQDPAGPRPPAYAALAVGRNADYTWAAATADPRGLLKPAPGAADRLAACWYSGSAGFDADVRLTDGQTHRVALYCVDWDWGGARSQTVTVRDAATGAVLDTRALSGFQGGVYLAWNVRGHVVFHVADVSGINAVLSAVFFDPSK